MATVTLDANTYSEAEAFAKKNNTDVTEVVRISVLNFLKKANIAKPVTKKGEPRLPEHLKKMRGILAGVEDPNDDKLNYLLKK